MMHFLCDACQNERGGYSTMRIGSLFFTAVFMGLWAAACIRTGQFVHFDWPDVSVLSAIWLAKAAQSRFELGSGGLSLFDNPATGVSHDS